MSENQTEIVPEDIARELAGLRAEVHRLNQHRFIRMHDKPWRLVIFQLTRGMAFGLGSVLGASVVLSIIVSLLSSIDFIPVIGDWATQIVHEIDIDSYGVDEEAPQ